ncbi:hypothetical protein ACLOJK_029132 [Asimina triloba]
MFEIAETKPRPEDQPRESTYAYYTQKEGVSYQIIGMESTNLYRNYDSQTTERKKLIVTGKRFETAILLSRTTLLTKEDSNTILDDRTPDSKNNIPDLMQLNALIKRESTQHKMKSTQSKQNQILNKFIKSEGKRIANTMTFSKAKPKALRWSFNEFAGSSSQSRSAYWQLSTRPKSSAYEVEVALAQEAKAKVEASAHRVRDEAATTKVVEVEARAEDANIHQKLLAVKSNLVDLVPRFLKPDRTDWFNRFDREPVPCPVQIKPRNANRPLASPILIFDFSSVLRSCRETLTSVFPFFCFCRFLPPPPFRLAATPSPSCRDAHPSAPSLALSILSSHCPHLPNRQQQSSHGQCLAAVSPLSRRRHLVVAVSISSSPGNSIV